MIDIIIPAYNAHDTLYKTLSSIALQTIKDKVNVYIINDYSKKSYKKEIDTFKDIFNSMKQQFNLPDDIFSKIYYTYYAKEKTND